MQSYYFFPKYANNFAYSYPLERLFSILSKYQGKILIAYQFYRQSTEEDKLNDVPNQSEDEPLRIINGLHYFVVVVHNGMF